MRTFNLVGCGMIAIFSHFPAFTIAQTMPNSDQGGSHTGAEHQRLNSTAEFIQIFRNLLISADDHGFISKTQVEHEFGIILPNASSTRKAAVESPFPAYAITADTTGYFDLFYADYGRGRYNLSFGWGLPNQSGPLPFDAPKFCIKFTDLSKGFDEGHWILKSANSNSDFSSKRLGKGYANIVISFRNDSECMNNLSVSSRIEH